VRRDQGAFRVAVDVQVTGFAGGGFGARQQRPSALVEPRGEPCRRGRRRGVALGDGRRCEQPRQRGQQPAEGADAVPAVGGSLQGAREPGDIEVAARQRGRLVR